MRLLLLLLSFHAAFLVCGKNAVQKLAGPEQEVFGDKYLRCCRHYYQDSLVEVVSQQNITLLLTTETRLPASDNNKK